ncbi:MAG TPA: hypothetical protein EYN91_16885 [Candidatus Melainabacteria bacterium]|nr:hypothetical protein [Candidatus Melainabacteria bacterium]HIN64675.1 hypothetical protein [Candidatus Obscuribacterales bacterium]
MLTVALLVVSNIFMTFAWYGHLNFKNVPIWQVILVSWGIAFFEYCLAVPANRFGSYQFTTAQLKIMQEVITLLVFSGFSILVLKEQLKWNYIAAFVLVVGAVSLVFLDTKGGRHKETAGSPQPAKALVANNTQK